MAKDYHVFISSKMVELAEERQVLHELLPTLGNDIINLRAWVFEDDAPASNQTIREVYLDALKSAALYIGLYWNEWGEWTIDEFKKATEWGIDRHIYVKNVNPDLRDPRLADFLNEQSDVISGITPKWFETAEDLREQISRSVQVWLKDHLQHRPGDRSAILAEFSDDIPDIPKKLIGRVAEVIQIRQFLDDESRVLLQGFGGMGKTAIAATVAAEWLDEDQGDVIWLKAGSASPDTILEAIAAPFDGQQEVASAPDTRAKTKAVRQILSSNDVRLVVLDDVWDGASLNQVMRAFPRSLPVLVTARQRYALDDIVEIGRMAEDGAVALLAHHARQDLKKDPFAAELCRQLGYHAFALEVAGKTLKVDQIAPGELLNRIATTPHDMTMPEDFAEEGRSSITELLDTSLYALDDYERRVFLSFGSLFDTDTTPELLALLLDEEVEAINEALLTLQRRGLVERLTLSQGDLNYYHIHNLSYSYARAIMQTQGRAAETQLAKFAEFVQMHAEDIPVLDVTHETWLGAAKSAHFQDEGELLIAIMLAVVEDYVNVRGHTLPLLKLLDAAITFAENLGQEYDETRHMLLSKRGNAYWQRSDYANALACYETALSIARQLGLADREVILLGIIGTVLAEMREAEEANRVLAEAYALADQLDDDFLRGFVVEKQAYQAQLEGDYELTRQFSTQQIHIAERINDSTTQVFALLNLGTAEKDLGNLEDALAHHHDMLELAQKAQNEIWIAHALQGIGEDYFALGNTEQAEAHLNEALTIFRERGLQAQVHEIEAFLDANF